MKDEDTKGGDPESERELLPHEIYAGLGRVSEDAGGSTLLPQIEALKKEKARKESELIERIKAILKK